MSAEQEITVDDADETWKERASQIRAVENEDGTLPAIVTGWTIKNDDTAVVSYQVRGVDEEETTELDASITPGEQSEFERFLGNLGDGYMLEDAEQIASNTPTVPVVEGRYDSWELADSLLEEHDDETEAGKARALAKGLGLGTVLVVFPVFGWLGVIARLLDMAEGELDSPKDRLAIVFGAVGLTALAVTALFLFVL